MGIPFSSRSTLRPWQGAVTDKNLSQGGERAKKYKPRHPGPRGSGELGEDHHSQHSPLAPPRSERAHRV